MIQISRLSCFLRWTRLKTRIRWLSIKAECPLPSCDHHHMTGGGVSLEREGVLQICGMRPQGIHTFNVASGLKRQQEKLKKKPKQNGRIQFIHLHAFFALALTCSWKKNWTLVIVSLSSGHRQLVQQCPLGGHKVTCRNIISCSTGRRGTWNLFLFLRGTWVL